MITIVTDENFEEEVENCDTPCVVGFTAGWCNLCPQVLDAMEALSEKYGDEIKFCSVNIDEQKELRILFAVAALPYTVFIQDGMKTPLFDEVVNEERLDERIRFILDGGKCPITVPLRRANKRN